MRARLRAQEVRHVPRAVGRTAAGTGQARQELRRHRRGGRGGAGHVRDPTTRGSDDGRPGRAQRGRHRRAEGAPVHPRVARRRRIRPSRRVRVVGLYQSRARRPPGGAQAEGRRARTVPGARRVLARRRRGCARRRAQLCRDVSANRLGARRKRRRSPRGFRARVELHVPPRAHRGAREPGRRAGGRRADERGRELQGEAHARGGGTAAAAGVRRGDVDRRRERASVVARRASTRDRDAPRDRVHVARRVAHRSLRAGPRGAHPRDRAANAGLRRRRRRRRAGASGDCASGGDARGAPGRARRGGGRRRRAR
mmetsp:Transcript_4234/g.17443  ORF Transcript_4234/g.17443 Transcript_4234/m.17443 type:complete len:312 (+) Transcript_4234:351-1286(+)